MKIGIVGYQGSGKSTLFEWLTGTPSDPAQAHKSQTAMAEVPEPLVADLATIYSPKKITLAALELVDTPGLSRDHEGSAAKLALIREAGCLIVVAAAFGGGDAVADLNNFEDDLLIADLDIVMRRIERLEEQIKKPRPDRDELQAELEALRPIHAALEDGKPIRDLELSYEQQRAVKSFQLLTLKPKLAVVNLADDDGDADNLAAKVSDDMPIYAIPLDLQTELAGMEETERAAFCEEMEVEYHPPAELLRTIMDVSGQMLFFTAGEKEVRTWMIHRGGTAVEAAGNIHTDLARGFIRAEVMQAGDLIRLGSEREIKAAGLVRQEHREYVIQEGDILLIRHN